MKRLIPMAVLVFLLASCAPAATPAPTSLSPMSTAAFAPIPTDTPIPIAIISPTPSPEFSMGLPKTVEQCNQVAWDEKTMPAFMQNHTQAVLEYADQQGWTADTVSPITLTDSGNFFTNKTVLPHSFLSAEIRNPNIADCTDITMPNGEHLVVLSVVTKIWNVDNPTLTVLNFVFDEQGIKNLFTAGGNAGSEPTAQGLLDAIHAIEAQGKPMMFDVQIWIPGQNSNATIEASQWPSTGVIETFNQQHAGSFVPPGIPKESDVATLNFSEALADFLHLSTWKKADPNYAPMFILEDELANKLKSLFIPVKTITIEAGK